jgi:hypothetical protein
MPGVELSGLGQYSMQPIHRFRPVLFQCALRSFQRRPGRMDGQFQSQTGRKSVRLIRFAVRLVSVSISRLCPFIGHGNPRGEVFAESGDLFLHDGMIVSGVLHRTSGKSSGKSITAPGLAVIFFRCGSPVDVPIRFSANGIQMGYTKSVSC